MDRETILVIDDNRRIADYWTNVLLPNLGYNTLVAYDGPSANSQIENNDVTLIVLDLKLRGLDGLDFLRQMQERGLTRPTILIVPQGTDTISLDAFHLGVKDYLIKPVEAPKLNESIQNALLSIRLEHEKSKLTAQLHEQLNYQSVLMKVGQTITASLNLDDVLRRIVLAGAELTQAEEGFLALRDEKTDRLYLRAAKNIAQDRARSIRIPIADTIVSEVFRSGKPARTQTQSSEDPLIKVSTGFLVHSLLHVPILSRGNALGVLSMVNHSINRPFQEKDEALLTALAAYAAIAIDNAFHYQNSQRENLERKKIEEALRESEERYALAVKGANDGIWDWDLRSQRVYYSPRWKEMLGFQEFEISSHPNDWFDRVHPDDLKRVQDDVSSYLKRIIPFLETEHRLLHKDGSYRWMLAKGQAVWDAQGQVIRLAGSLSDVNDRKLAEDKLLHDAFHDKLTGLANRSLFIDHLAMALERSKRKKDYIFAVLFLDLDRFKDINDSMGHIFGDQLLVAIARILENRLRPTDTIARFGGDEYVILLDDLQDSSNATTIANWIRAALSSPLRLGSQDVFITASVGIVLSETGYTKPEDILRDADIAMYHAKNTGKAHFEIFDPEMRAKIMDRINLENELRRAITNNELETYYQVIHSLQTGLPVGFEALVRWNHPQRGILLPKDFLPLAEDTGLIIQIDRWMLEQACQQLNKWHLLSDHTKSMSVSVNFSGRQFSDPDVVEAIANILHMTELPPQFINIEISESILVYDHKPMLQACMDLAALGINIQIDDFGSGYSSLSFLAQFGFSALKIDRNFIGQIIQHEKQAEIVKAIVNLSRRLSVDVIAEGVETNQQLSLLKAMGCHYAQGYLLSQPIPASEVSRQLIDFELT